MALEVWRTQISSCKNVEACPRKNNLSCFKLLLVIGLWDIILTSLLPPIQSCSSKFWAWSCIASNFDKGWSHHKHKIMDRSFMPKYSVSSTFATVCSIFKCRGPYLQGSLVKETVTYISSFKWWKHYLATDTKIKYCHCYTYEDDFCFLKWNLRF